MQYYNSIITQKSFLYLQELKKKYKFILIGGWAVYCYSKSLKSKDVDIIVDYDILSKIKEAKDVIKNERLSKYEINEGNFDVDIYVPHYSKLGIDIEEIKKSVIQKEGFIVPSLEILFLMKLYAWYNRRGSNKGQKDELDIFSLALLPEFDWNKYIGLIKKFNFWQYHNEFIQLLKKTSSIKDLNISQQKMSKIKKDIILKLNIKPSQLK